MRILSPKLMISTALVLTVFILFSLAQEMNRRLQIQREVLALEQQARELERNLISMENLNQYFKTEAFQERMAREKLNYRAEGEKVVLITEDYEPVVPESREIESNTTISIPRKWWDTFFGNQLTLDDKT